MACSISEGRPGSRVHCLSPAVLTNMAIMCTVSAKEEAGTGWALLVRLTDHGPMLIQLLLLPAEVESLLVQ